MRPRRGWPAAWLAFALSLAATGQCGAAEQPPSAARVLLQTSLTAGLAHHEAKEVWEELRPGDRLELRREPSNPHDPYAVQIWREGRLLGYLPRADNRDVARQLDRGQPLEGRIRSVARYRNHRRKLEIDVFLAW
jgi:hypothetical protein